MQIKTIWRSNFIQLKMGIINQTAANADGAVGKGSPRALLVPSQVSFEVPQKLGNRTTLCSSLTLLFSTPQWHFHNCFYCCIIHDSQCLNQPTLPSTGECIEKMLAHSEAHPGLTRRESRRKRCKESHRSECWELWMFFSGERKGNIKMAYVSNILN